MGFGTIGDVDDLTIFTVITNRQCAKQFAITGVITNDYAIFGYAGITGALKDDTVRHRTAAQSNSRFNSTAAVLSNCHTAIA